MSEALWFLLGASLSFNFFLLWKLSEANETIDDMMSIPIDEDVQGTEKDKDEQGS